MRSANSETAFGTLTEQMVRSRQIFGKQPASCGMCKSLPSALSEGWCGIAVVVRLVVGTAHVFQGVEIILQIRTTAAAQQDSEGADTISNSGNHLLESHLN